MTINISETVRDTDSQSATSIFRAELYALTLAIDVVRRNKENNFLIFSDSMSSLQAIDGFNIESDLVHKFLKDYSVLTENGKKMLFYVASLVMWESVVMKKLTKLQSQL